MTAQTSWECDWCPTVVRGGSFPEGWGRMSQQTPYGVTRVDDVCARCLAKGRAWTHALLSRAVNTTTAPVPTTNTRPA